MSLNKKRCSFHGLICIGLHIQPSLARIGLIKCVWQRKYYKKIHRKKLSCILEVLKIDNFLFRISLFFINHMLYTLFEVVVCAII
jgi:hypothetical protein